MGKKSAPAPDPRIGDAAMASAANGKDYLDFMKNQASVTNGWATEDRKRYQDTFVPLQDQFIKDAQEWDSPAREAARVDQNRAAVSGNIATAQGMQQRQMAAMGVSPNSGRAAAVSATTGVQTGLALAGAENTAMHDVRAEADARKAQAINMGSGLAINPAQSMGISNGAASAGFQGNGQGLGQQGQMLNGQYQNEMQQWQANQSASAGLFSGIGSLVGLAFGSDKNIKKDMKKPGRSLLEAVDAMPIEEWTYKDGKGDGGSHVGTYAQDFKKHTGMGDGKTINVIDAIGTAMGAIQELSAKVNSMTKGRSLPADAGENEPKAHEAGESPAKKAAETRKEANGISDDQRKGKMQLRALPSEAKETDTKAHEKAEAKGKEAAEKRRVARGLPEDARMAA